MEKMKRFVKQAIDNSKLNELSMIAKSVLYELNLKITFINVYMNKNLTDQTLMLIKDEIDAFESGTAINQLRIAYDTFCHKPRS